MAEYDLIERNKIFEKVTELYRYSKGDMHIAYRELLDYILDMPVADVQPFRWIKCEESLPVYDGLVLVADKNNNIRLGIYTETGWLSQFGNPMMPRPKAWAKIPDLPETIKG